MTLIPDEFKSALIDLYRSMPETHPPMCRCTLMIGTADSDDAELGPAARDEDGQVKPPEKHRPRVSGTAIVDDGPAIREAIQRLRDRGEL